MPMKVIKWEEKTPEVLMKRQNSQLACTALRVALLDRFVSKPKMRIYNHLL